MIKNMTGIVCVYLILCLKRSVQGIKEDYFPEIIDRESTYRAMLNDSICLPCKLTKQYSDHRKCLFYWTKDGSVVLQWPRYRVKSNRCLRIRNIRSSDHAKYVCYAYSEVGNAQAVRNLIVLNRDVNATHQPEAEKSTKFKPSVPVPIFFRDTLKRTAKLIRKYFYIGRRAKLKCAIVGSPPPMIKWFHNGVPLDSSTFVYIRPRSFALLIKHFTPNHIGNYTCVGSNGRGIVNMSFLVSNKAGDPNPPLPIKGERLVTEGDNVTLHCKKPANKVKWLVWHVPKRELRKQQGGRNDRNFEPFGYLSEPPKSINYNGSVIKDFALNNISRIHAGLYHCLALYKRSRRPIPVKIVHLKIQTGNKLPVITTSSPNNEILLVKIAVPVMGSLLTLVVVVICFRCRRKSSMNNPVKAKPDDDDDTLSMQILPNIPTGTLRIHKSLQEFTDKDPMFTGDVAKSKDTDKANTVEYRKGDGTSMKLSPSLRHILYENSHTPYGRTVSNDSCYSIPESNASMKYSSSHEKEKHCKLQTKNIQNNKKHRHIKRQQSRGRNNEFVTNCENSLPSYYPHCGVVNNKISVINIQDSPEEEDHLLQREMKNWEPLLRDSTSYRNGGDGDSQKYNTTVCEDKTSMLIASQCNDAVNLLITRSDCSQHIVI